MSELVQPAIRIDLRDLDRVSVPDSAPVSTPVVAPLAQGAIGLERKVTLFFSLQLENGEVIDSNFEKAPATFVVGDGSMLPGFEQALAGLVAGEHREFMLEPEQAFGSVNEDNVQRFPLYRFPPDLALENGTMVEFADAAGNTQAGVVRKADKTWVEVDFNHPLAGRKIRFSVLVQDVAQVAQT